MSAVQVPERVHQAAPRPLNRKKIHPGKIAVNAILVITSLVWLLPVYWMVNSAFQTERNLLSSPPKLIPAPLTTEHFAKVLSSPAFHSALLMSLGAAVITVVATTLCSLLAALALARFNFRGRRTLIVAILVIQMIPAEALFISQYRMLDSWALLNSVAGLSLLYVGGVLPFVTWMMRGYVEAVPEELEQAAMIDGCTRIQAFMRVTLPLLAPGLVSTSVFAFLHSWNEYTLALIVLSRDSAVTLPLWLQSFQQGLQGSDWGGVMAGSTLITIPVLILFIFVQNRMSTGMVSGAVKG